MSLKSKIEAMSLTPLARTVRRERLTYLSVAKLRRLEQALREVNRRGLAGDFVEFGVALGGSAILIAQAAKSRVFHGLDVFAMIPPPTSEKDDLKSKQRFATIAAGKSSGLGADKYYGYRSDLFADVQRAFERHGLAIDGRQRQLHKGLFEDTWPSVASQSLAFAHIDCDWYDPVRYCLQAVASIAVPGALVVIDDYHDYGGCRTAVDEFLGEHGDFRLRPGVNPILQKVCTQSASD